MSRNNNRGFSIAELVITISVLGVLLVAAFTLFAPSITEYFNLQNDATNWGNLANQSQRIARVLRGLVDITSANDNDISVYAYFSPNDSYTSLIHYYKNGTGTKLMADVTPMTANPPTGTLLTAQKRTYTIIDNYYTASGVNLFTYLNDAGVTIPTPISDEHTIKGITVTLAVPVQKPSQSGNDTINVQVSLRNRKTNL